MQLPVVPRSRVVIDRDGLQDLIAGLRAAGFRVIGPTIRATAITLGDVATVDDLPAGWTDEQQGGRYRLKRRDDRALFGYASGPQSWKQFLFPPRSLLWRSTRDGEVTAETDSAAPLAFLGVRSCDLEAIKVQDRIFMGSGVVDPGYRTRREGAFIVR